MLYKRNISKPNNLYMKPFLIFFFLVYSNFDLIGQDSLKDATAATKNKKNFKSVIDSNAIETWPILENDPILSNDGKYYKFNFIVGNERNILVISDTGNKWKVEIQGAEFRSDFFSKDSKQCIYKINDTLCFLNLYSKNIRKIEGVGIVKQPENQEGQWFAYLRNRVSLLVLYDIINDKEYTFDSVEDFYFDKHGKCLVIKSSKNNGDSKNTVLKYITLPDCKCFDIWQGVTTNSISEPLLNAVDISPGGFQVAFIVRENNVASKTELCPIYDLWYYKLGMERAVLLVNNKSLVLNEGLAIYNSVLRFSNDGEFIYFQLWHPDIRKVKPDAVMVDIWNFKDTILQCTQLGMKSPKTYTAVVNINQKIVTRLTKDYENIKTPFSNNSLIVGHNTTGDRFWSNKPDTNWLVSLNERSWKLLPTGNKRYFFSPLGKYLLYYDLVDYNYYRYDVNTNEKINISKNIPFESLAFKSEFNIGEPDNLPRESIGVAGWSEKDNAFFVYDNYDIWMLDPTGKKPALNLTNGYGRLHHIKFRFTFGMFNDNETVVFNNDEQILLTAYNVDNKYNGFYVIWPNKKQDPKLLVNGPYVFDLSAKNLLPLNAQNFTDGIGMAPIKAKNAKVWIIQKQSTCEAPNYFLTKDFKRFKPLTNFQPQASYNWLTGELITWKQLDGRSSQGILYKPEDFDSSKKYPIIFNYYQQRSHRMYQFPTPEYAIADIDIPWFVSRGYLVFTPDIYFKNNETGKSAYNTIVSAAEHLSKLPYIDGNKIGINGHSIGGGLTNHLITHTNKFAAAVECAGVSDAISASLQLGKVFFEISRLESMEDSKGGVSIWEKPEMYLASSPIMRANTVTTPLLIMHNKADGGVPWAQAVELFIALRRLEKPVWMLQYDDGGHSLWGKKNESKDYTIRVTQFFDHYLKSVPAPKWMVHGIPARLKGIESGYELEKEQ